MKIELFEEGENTTIKEYQKSQAVRVWDIVVLAPFLIYIGYKAKGISTLERNFIYFIGISTLIYNGRNYLKNKQKRG
jgi:hypothetical protein